MNDLNFESWCDGATGRRLRRMYSRIYIKGNIWTPFVVVTWKFINSKQTKEKSPTH